MFGVGFRPFLVHLLVWFCLCDTLTAFQAGVTKLRTTPPSSFLSQTSSSSSSSSSSDATAAAAISSLFRKGSPLTSSSSSDQAIFDGTYINGSTITDAASSIIDGGGQLSPFQSALVRIGMISYIVGMCIALPVTLLPQRLILKLGFINRIQSERNALSTGRFCSRWLMRIIPFCKLQTITQAANPNPQPAVWVCNHQSLLDVFVLMAADRKLRGKNKRPMKIIYWKGLEDNPVTKLLFTQCGFIPVAMAANKPGETNEYDKGSFKKLLQGCKQAFSEGFDVAILPEGQLNPHPERGLLPTFAGAYTLARMAKRPIHMMALHGTHNLWHPVNGMTASKRVVKIRNYHSNDTGRSFDSSEEFTATFEKVIGQFGTYGTDLPDNELEAWLSGAAWKKRQSSSKE